MNSLETNANNQAFLEALKTFDVKAFKTYMKTWQRKSYKKYSKMNYIAQKSIMCQCIVDNKKLLDKDLVKKANDYIKSVKKRAEEMDKNDHN